MQIATNIASVKKDSPSVGGTDSSRVTRSRAVAAKEAVLPRAVGVGNHGGDGSTAHPHRTNARPMWNRSPARSQLSAQLQPAVEDSRRCPLALAGGIVSGTLSLL